MDLPNSIREKPVAWLLSVTTAILVFLGTVWAMFFGGRTMQEIVAQGGWMAMTIRSAIWLVLFLFVAVGATQIPAFKNRRNSPQAMTFPTIIIVGLVAAFAGIGIWWLLTPLASEGAAAKQDEWPALSAEEKVSWIRDLSHCEVGLFGVHRGGRKTEKLADSLLEIASVLKWSAMVDQQALPPGISIYAREEEPATKAFLRLFERLHYDVTVTSERAQERSIQIYIGDPP